MIFFFADILTNTEFARPLCLHSATPLQLAASIPLWRWDFSETHCFGDKRNGNRSLSGRQNAHSTPSNSTRWKDANERQIARCFNNNKYNFHHDLELWIACELWPCFIFIIIFSFLMKSIFGRRAEAKTKLILCLRIVCLFLCDCCVFYLIFVCYSASFTSCENALLFFSPPPFRCPL